MRLLDIGANRGDATLAGLESGYKVVAVEAAPRIFAELVKNFIYNPDVIPLRYAVSDNDFQRVAFYEAVEDGLSSLNRDWLTKDGLPYARKPHREISATTITVDTLIDIYGEFDLIKIDVEGAEWNVFHGMSQYHGELTFEWTYETLDEHEAQLDYLYSLGYRLFSPQFIMPHLVRPRVHIALKDKNAGRLHKWHEENAQDWIDGGWRLGNLRPTADVGMCWVR